MNNVLIVILGLTFGYALGLQACKRDVKKSEYERGHHSRDSHRYFLINYKTNEIGNGRENYGAFWFKQSQFPSKNFLDSSIYSCLEKDKCCYNHIIITDIYEFKDSNDFNAFGKDYEGSWDAPASKDSVCETTQFEIR